MNVDITINSLGNPICPHQTHPRHKIKARCIGCPKAMTCKERDPSLPRVFPKVRKGAIAHNVKNLISKNDISKLE